MARDDPDENVREIAENAERMLREGVEKIVFGCGSGRSDPCDFLVLEPPPGASTVRCWKAPDIEAEPGEAFRALAGRSTHAFDRFEEGAERWRRIVVQEVDGRACWVRDERLRRIGLSEAPPGYPEPAVPEFDLPVDRVRSESFVRLEEWGVVRTFDPGDTLVGVALSVDPADEIGLELLRTATGWSETPLGEAVRAILPEIESRHGTLEGWEAWTPE